MKSNTLKLAILFCLSVFAVITFASCNLIVTPEPGEILQTQARSALINVPELSRKDELALLRLSGNYMIPKEELLAKVQVMLQPYTGMTKRSVSSVTGTRSFSVTVENGFSPVTANNRTETTAIETSEIPFFVFYVENHAEQTSGFAFASGDARIGGLLALVYEGDFDCTENPLWQMFLSLLNEYIQNTIELYNSLTDEDIAAAVAKSGAVESLSALWPGDLVITSRVEPLLRTQWDQSARWPLQHDAYNSIVNRVAGNAD